MCLPLLLPWISICVYSKCATPTYLTFLLEGKIDRLIIESNVRIAKVNFFCVKKTQDVMIISKTHKYEDVNNDFSRLLSPCVKLVKLHSLHEWRVCGEIVLRQTCGNSQKNYGHFIHCRIHLKHINTRL